MLLEILDLDVAHFVEYKPEFTFSAKEFQVTEVLRDTAWFARNLPLMKSFCEELQSVSDNEIQKRFTLPSDTSAAATASSTCVVLTNGTTSPDKRAIEAAGHWLGI